jgi:hypothetical protein
VYGGGGTAALSGDGEVGEMLVCCCVIRRGRCILCDLALGAHFVGSEGVRYHLTILFL